MELGSNLGNKDTEDDVLDHYFDIQLILTHADMIQWSHIIVKKKDGDGKSICIKNSNPLIKNMIIRSDLVTC